MSKVETKADLLRFMRRHDACVEATKWVRSRKEKTFLEIWNACPKIEWLYWLMYKQNPRLACAWWDYVIQGPLPDLAADESYGEAWDRVTDLRLKVMKRAYRG